MKEETKELLRDFCRYWSKEFLCKPCETCALYGVLWLDTNIYDRGWTLQQAIRIFGRTSIPETEARKILEEKMGLPLDIVTMLLREIKDYEDCRDV